MPKGKPNPSLNFEAAEKEIRKKAIQDFIKLANKIEKRDSWFIGRFLGVVEEEWDQLENK